MVMIAQVLRTGLAVILIGVAAAVSAQDDVINSGVWAIRGTAVETRWIEIHQVEKRNGAPLYHVEVLGRKKGNPSWQVAHLAITGAALKRSITGPSRDRGVYPETFDGAYVQWQELDAAGKAPICDRSVEDCMGRQ
jgi:Domain of unknown function (DUF5086)